MKGRALLRASAQSKEYQRGAQIKNWDTRIAALARPVLGFCPSVSPEPDNRIVSLAAK